MDKVLYENKEQLGVITINRPEVHNAIDFEVMDLLKQYLSEAKADPGVKLLVIKGSGGKAFCSGGDLTAFHQLHTEHEAYAMLSKMSDVLNEIFFFPKPTIALLNGTAVGGGCEIAAACDMRLAKAEAKMGFIQGKLGITTGWGGGTYILERLPKAVALDLLWSAQLMTAKQGRDIGFVQYLIKEDDMMASAKKYFNRYTVHSTECLQAYKQRYLDSIDTAGIKLRVEQEVRHCAKLWETDEHKKAVADFLNKK